MVRGSLLSSIARTVAAVDPAWCRAPWGANRPDRVLRAAERWLDQLATGRRLSKRVTVGRPVPLAALLAFDGQPPAIDDLGEIVKVGAAPAPPRLRV